MTSPTPTNNPKSLGLAVFVIFIFVFLLASGGFVLWYFQHPAATTLTLAKDQDDSNVAPTPAHASGAPGIVYTANFDTEPGPEWSARAVATTLDGSRYFLGPIDENELVFKIDNLPEHTFIRVTFELLTYQPWNGDSANFGRDAFDLRAGDDRPLIHTTFSNCGFFTDNSEQSFPDQYPWYPTHPAWTGASAHQSLGYKYRFGEGEPLADDSTYTFDLTFPHDDDSLELLFQTFIKSHANKPYGIMNFKVETLDHGNVADTNTLMKWWNDLADEDPVKAYHAVWSLIATGDLATHFIKDKFAALPADVSVPWDVDQSKLWTHGSFQYADADSRQRARAIHVLEVIDNDEASDILDSIDHEDTPAGVPPDRWTKPAAKKTTPPR